MQKSQFFSKTALHTPAFYLKNTTYPLIRTYPNLSTYPNPPFSSRISSRYKFTGHEICKIFQLPACPKHITMLHMNHTIPLLPCRKQPKRHPAFSTSRQNSGKIFRPDALYPSPRSRNPHTKGLVNNESNAFTRRL